MEESGLHLLNLVLFHEQTRKLHVRRLIGVLVLLGGAAALCIKGCSLLV